ncbi:MAG: hypothetical protein HXS53_04275 [Theionarchaea archaeon]|nr:hypothetical protein [Theionarchaea archaeon]
MKLHYSFLCVLAGFFLLPHTRVPICILQLLTGILLFYGLPGIYLSHRFFHAARCISGIFLIMITGMCFHVCYLYVLSLFSIPFSSFLLLIPGIIFALLADYEGVRLPSMDKSELYLCAAAVLFFMMTFTISPQEDANGHLLLVSMTLEKTMLPHSYSLYPGVSISYHMGFHALVSELSFVSGFDAAHLLPFMGAVWGMFLMISSYLCLRILHGEKAGFVGGILVCFASIPPLYYLSYGAYASMISFTLQPLVIYFVYASRDPWDIPLVSLVLAAGFMSHASFLLFWIPLITLTRTHKLLVPAFLLSLVFSIPFLIRFQPSYSPPEILQLEQLWFIPETFRTHMLVERIGIPLLICGLGGIILRRGQEKILFITWIASLLCLAVLSATGITFPFQFLFLANRLIDFMFLPLALLSGIFLSEILKGKYILLSFLLLVTMLPSFYFVPRYSGDTVFYADSEDFHADQEGIDWLVENTPQDTIILNEWWTGTGSSWISSLGNRRVIFPFLYVHDHFLENLSVAEHGRDVSWISLSPDSPQALALLSEWKVDYIFLSSFVEDRVRWRRDSWDISTMASSPNYRLVFNNRETYIFKVNPESCLFSRMVQAHLPPSGSTEYLTSSTTLRPFLLLTYRDSGIGRVGVWSDDGLLSAFPLLGTGEDITILLPFDPSQHFVSESPLEKSESSLVFTLPGYDLGWLSLSWDWNCGAGYLLEREGHVYTHGVRGLKITYIDDSQGNVDVNLFANGEWQLLTIIERKGDGMEKELFILLPDLSVPLDIGFHVYGPPFSVLSFECVE